LIIEAPGRGLDLGRFVVDEGEVIPSDGSVKGGGDETGHAAP
jgi:hypothetical protein